jgi:membrane associated rhomboid family serine protease
MLDPLETILRQCSEAAPGPWYPSEYARTKGIARDDLDPHLDQLRMAGLIHLTDWVQGHGQGYALTPDGQYVLESPRELAKLRAGKINRAREVQQPSGTADRGTTAFERGEEIRYAFLHPSPPVVSLTLIFLNVAWFVPEILLSVRYQLPLNEFLVGGGQALHRVLDETGALSASHIVQGEWWRLLSCCFVHIGLLHLGLNMWGLYAVGPFLEQLWGRARFLVLYLIAGLGGSCAMVITNPIILEEGKPPLLQLGAGASGAIWGILTAHMVWIILNRRYLPPALGSQMLRRIVFVLLLQVVFTQSVKQISGAAHYGGGAAGALAAFLLSSHRYGNSRQRRLALLGLIAMPVLCVGAVVTAKRIDPRWQLIPCLQIYQETTEQLRGPEIEPLGQQPLRRHSLLEVRHAVDGFGKARALVYDAVDRLQKAGPIRQGAPEDLRQAYIQALEKRGREYESNELGNWVGPLIADAVRQASRVYQDEHGALQKLDPEQRTPDVVEQAIARCRQARLDVEAVTNVLRAAGPFRNQKFEALRLREIGDMEGRLEGWERTEQRMRKMAHTMDSSRAIEPN